MQKEPNVNTSDAGDTPPSAGEEVIVAGESMGASEAGSTAGNTAGDTAGNMAGNTAGNTAGDTAGNTAGDTAGDTAGNTPIDCDISEAMAPYGCQSVGCHASPTRSGLNLVDDGFGDALVNASSLIQGCEGRKLIDPQDPSKSLILQAVGAELPPLGDQDTCQVLMPSPEVEVAEEHQVCFRTWVNDIASRYEEPVDDHPFEPSPVASAVRKVKTLLMGDAPTTAEINSVTDDQSALRNLAMSWIDSERGQDKLLSFFGLALQQEMGEEDIEQFDRLRRHRSLNAPFRKVMSESFARTALDLVANDQPFNRIATTREWVVTTANLVLLMYPDQSQSQRQQQHTVTPVDNDAPDRLSAQVAQRTWYVPSCLVPA